MRQLDSSCPKGIVAFSRGLKAFASKDTSSLPIRNCSVSHGSQVTTAHIKWKSFSPNFILDSHSPSANQAIFAYVLKSYLISNANTEKRRRREAGLRKKWMRNVVKAHLVQGHRDGGKLHVAIQQLSELRPSMGPFTNDVSREGEGGGLPNY